MRRSTTRRVGIALSRGLKSPATIGSRSARNVKKARSFKRNSGQSIAAWRFVLSDLRPVYLKPVVDSLSCQELEPVVLPVEPASLESPRVQIVRRER
jgi:hypothetical protein